MAVRRLSMVVVAALGLAAAAGPAAPAGVRAQAAVAGAIAYVAPAAETGSEVRLVDAAGDARRFPIDLVAVSYPVWSRDGGLLAVTGTAPGGEAADVFVCDATGEHLRQVTHLSVPGRTFDPLFKAFSPDGKRLAIVAIADAPPGSVYRGIEVVLLVIDVDGTDQTIVSGTAVTGEGFPGFGVDWSPVADVLVAPAATLDISSGNPVGVTALFAVPPVADADQQGLARQLTFPAARLGTTVDDRLPVFSPDGTRLAFVRRFRDVFAATPPIASLRLLDLRTGREREVLSLPGEGIYGLGWSGDGTRLVFDRGQESGDLANPGGAGVWVVNADGTGLTQVVAGPAATPTWRWR